MSGSQERVKSVPMIHTKNANEATTTGRGRPVRRQVPFLLDGMNKSHYSLYNPRELAKGRDAHLCPHHQQPGQQEHNTSKRAAAKCVEVEQSTNGTTLWKYHVERGHSANRPV